MAEIDMRHKVRKTLDQTQKMREDTELLFSRLKNQEESLRDIYTFFLFGTCREGGIMDALCETMSEIENKSYVWRVDDISYSCDGRFIDESRGYLIDRDLYSKYPHLPNGELRSDDIKSLREERNQFVSIFERISGLDVGPVKDYWGDSHEYIRGIHYNPYLIDFGRNNEISVYDQGEGKGVFSSISNERYDYLLSFVDYCVDWRLQNLEDVYKKTIFARDCIWPKDLSQLVKSYTKNYHEKK